MLNKTVASALISIILLIFGQSACATEKLAVLRQVNSIAQELINIAQRRQTLPSNVAGKGGAKEIERLIRAQNDLDVLVRVAISTRANRFPGRAEDQVIDNVMDEAWTRSIGRIEQIGGSAAISSLELIEGRERLDGADSLDVRNAIARLKAR